MKKGTEYEYNPGYVDVPAPEGYDAGYNTTFPFLAIELTILAGVIAFFLYKATRHG